MNVQLTPELEALVQEKVRTGRYVDESEVVRDALRLLDRLDGCEDQAAQRLREALDEGYADLAAGRVTVVDTAEELDAVFAAL